jgi:tetratricopeptide (TPR) repeat protein
MGAAVSDAALADPDGEVRAAAAGNASPIRQGALLAALLGDPLRAVRIAAARSLAAAPGALPQASRNAYARALDEYRAAQGAMADAPAARLSLGLLEEDLGRPAGAEAHYRAALGMDRHLVPARLALAERLAARGALDEAEALLREGLSLGADEGGLRQALAALRTGRLHGPTSPDR